MLVDDSFSVASWDAVAPSTELSSPVLELQADLTQADEAMGAATETTKRLGRIEVLVNAVGIAQPHELFANMTAKQWDEVIGVNLLAPVNCMRAVIDDMRSLGAGTIVNICSIWSTHAEAQYRSAYIASKWGLLGATRAIATELVRDGVRVCAVSPGPVDTPMTAGISTPEARSTWMTPDDVVHAVRYAVSTGARSLVGGEIQIFGSVRPDPQL
jgi:3-oxoacyl-[acyl-carrier protein] reductase